MKRRYLTVLASAALLVGIAVGSTAPVATGTQAAGAPASVVGSNDLGWG